MRNIIRGLLLTLMSPVGNKLKIWSRKMMKNTALKFLLVTTSALLFVGCAANNNPSLSVFAKRDSAPIQSINVISDCYVNTFFEKDESTAIVDRPFNYGLCKAVTDAARQSLIEREVVNKDQISLGPISIGGQLGGTFRVQGVSGEEKAQTTDSFFLVPEVNANPQDRNMLSHQKLMSGTRKVSERWRNMRTTVVFGDGKLGNGVMPQEYFDAVQQNQSALQTQGHTLLLITGGQLIVDKLDAQTDAALAARRAAGAGLSLLLSGGNTLWMPGGTNLNSGVYTAAVLVDPQGTVIWNGFSGGRLKKSAEKNAEMLVKSISVTKNM